MTRNILALTAFLTVVTMVGAAVIIAGLLPADMPLPIHWGLDGEPDRFSDKWTALLLPPVLTAGISLLFYFLPDIEPRRHGLERSQGLYLWSWLALLLMMGVLQLALAALALRWPLHANHLIVGGLGAMLVMIGNQLGKSRSMYLIGFRTPWTLASENVWIGTHRLAGKLMVAGGVLMLVTAILPIPSGVLATCVLGVFAVVICVPTAFSFLLWRRERQAQPSE